MQREAELTFQKAFQERTSHITQSIERNDLGEPLRLSGTRLDITERKNAELQLKFREITVDHSHDAVFWITEDGYLIYGDGVVSAGEAGVGWGGQAMMGMACL